MNQHSWHDPHIIRTGKSLLKALYTTIGLFVLLFVCFHIAGALYTSSLSKTASTAFHTGIAKDLAHLKEQGDIVAKNDLVQKYLTMQDSVKLIEVLRTERDARDIGLIGVTNSEGVILGRTKSVGVIGDNVFLTNPVGRIVAQGKSAESVETPFGFAINQIFLTTGRPIMRDTQMVGALFANYLTDDAYATRFQDSYLPPGVKVVFYNKDGGIYGDSFSDPETRKRISSYFNSGSEWIRDGSSGKTVSFRDGSFYLVENIIFPGLEKSPGGALLFIPRRDFSGTANLITALLTLLIFIFLALRYHLRSRGEEYGWRYYTLLVGVSLPVLMLSLFALTLQHMGYARLEKIPYPLYNSTLRFQPDSGIYDMGFEQHFSIVADTGDEDINAVQVGLTFDPEAVEVKMLDTKNSACSYIIENTVHPKEGKVKFACVILASDTGSRSSLQVADVVVLPKRAGTFTLSFDKDETKVLADDGIGTDVLRMSQSSSYRVGTFDQSLFTPTPTPTPTPTRTFVVFSSTHPNQSRWYNADVARFVWRGKPDAVYAYDFDNSPDTVPSKMHTTQGSAIDITIPGDGIFYFHLQLVSGGPIASYRIQSDKTPPSIASIHLSEDTVVAGDVVRLSFDGEDTGSGIQKNYYIDLGSHLFLPIGAQLFVPFLKAGDEKMTLRIYDNAGNYSEKSQIVHVQPKP